MFNNQLQKAITQGALLGKTVKAKAPLFATSKRQFSSGGIRTAGSMVAYGVAGASVAGLSYLSYKGAMMRKNMTPEMQLTMFHPVV